MPHVGGGSGSGSGGFSHSSSSSTPRVDSYGNRHSSYYIRPGYYYNSIYVPYSRVNRTYHTFKGLFTILFTSLIFIIIGIIALVKSNGKTTSKLEKYSLAKYEEIYKVNKTDYESNLLIVIVPNKEANGIDYLPIVGDNVNKSVDEAFGNRTTLFGSKLYANLDASTNEVKEIYSIIAKSLNETTPLLTYLGEENNTQTSVVKNETNLDLGSSLELETAQNDFYERTRYRISTVIAKYDDVYKNTYAIPSIIIGVGVLVLVFFIYKFIQTRKALNAINQAEQEGTAKKHFEGEVEYDTFIKDHSPDEKFYYDADEYFDKQKDKKTEDSK